MEEDVLLKDLIFNIVKTAPTSPEYRKSLEAIRREEIGGQTLGLGMDLEKKVVPKGMVDYPSIIII